LNCLGLEAIDHDSKGKTKTESVRVKTMTKTVTLKGECNVEKYVA